MAHGFFVTATVHTASLEDGLFFELDFYCLLGEREREDAAGEGVLKSTAIFL